MKQQTVKTVKKSALLKKDVCVEVYNRLAGEGCAPDPSLSWNWLTIAWFAKGVDTAEDVRKFVSRIKEVLTPSDGIKPLGRIRVTYSKK